MFLPHIFNQYDFLPFGEIPLLQYGDLTLYETAAICRFIDRRFEGPALTPKSLNSLVKIDQWVSAALCYIDPTAECRCALLSIYLVAPSAGAYCLFLPYYRHP